MKLRLHVMLGLLALQVSSVLSFAYQFELDGTMTYKSWMNVQATYSMQVYVQDCQWAIFKTYEWTTNRCITEMSSDGDYIYCLDRIETNIGAIKPEDYTQAYPNGWSGEIHPASFPYDNLNTEGIALFYAYASSSYLNTHTNQVVGTAQIPLNIRITRYTSNHTSILATYEFQVKRVAGMCSLKSFKPALPGWALITDFRVPHFLASDPGSSRIVTNGWPTLQAE